LQGIFAAAHDITEHKRLDQMLREKNIELESAKLAAEKANIAKSVFLSSMSHELRTPLNAILGFAQLLESASPPPTETQTARLQQITKAGWYLLELINEVLDLAVIESGNLSLTQEPVSLTEIMNDCLTMIEPQAQQRGIRVDLLPFDSTCIAYADPIRLKQVLLNLLANAIKYNLEQGTIIIKCGISLPDHIRISIKDSGAGLPPEKLAQLFQPFNRLGQEAGREEGTGIGLVVAKRLIELMGGSIGVTSRIGMGSEFWIELIRNVAPLPVPVITSPAKHVPQSAHRALENTAVRTLLYVDDNPDNLMLVEQLIAAQPHLRMLSASDSNLGIALARTRLPDVILMDINLPGISGIEAMNILHADPATAHIPVIALSANVMLRNIWMASDAGFFRYLSKPIKLDELISALNDAIQLS
jgi:CheY-like chemotaxis protein/nitrogen-specific signal transduction histidine kinase